MSDSPTKPPRFPYAVAFLCAVCIGVAAWSWMRHSYAWRMTPETLLAAIDEHHETLSDDLPDPRDKAGDPCPLVALRGIPVAVRKLEDSYPWVEYSRTYPGRKLLVHEPGNMRRHVWVHCGWIDPTSFSASDEFTGRVYYEDYPITIDMTASRFTGSTIAGLAVGAMGVAAFVGACWLWLRRRSKFRG